jgi:hypothetical protein
MSIRHKLADQQFSRSIVDAIVALNELAGVIDIRAGDSCPVGSYFSIVDGSPVYSEGYGAVLLDERAEMPTVRDGQLMAPERIAAELYRFMLHGFRGQSSAAVYIGVIGDKLLAKWKLFQTEKIEEKFGRRILSEPTDTCGQTASPCDTDVCAVCATSPAVTPIDDLIARAAGAQRHADPARQLLEDHIKAKCSDTARARVLMNNIDAAIELDKRDQLQAQAELRASLVALYQQKGRTTMTAGSVGEARAAEPEKLMGCTAAPAPTAEQVRIDELTNLLRLTIDFCGGYIRSANVDRHFSNRDMSLAMQASRLTDKIDRALR